ncbi:hypothetical protein JCM10207_002915 [Rhodosporidiobolus poonsookiae]
MDLERFVDPLPEFLHCLLCLDAAYQPVVTCSQEHIICQACYEKLRRAANQQQGCPTCRSPCTFRESPALRRAIESFKIKCKEKRCSWTGSITDEKTHNVKECSYRPVRCLDCGKTHPFADKAHHHSTCPNVRISCVRGGKDCGGVTDGGVFRRKDAPQHDTVCTNFRCAVTPGCPTKTTLANRQAHETHCLDTRRRITTLEAELAAAKKALEQRDRAPGQAAEKMVEKGKGKAVAGDDEADVAVKKEDADPPGAVGGRVGPSRLLGRPAAANADRVVKSDRDFLAALHSPRFSPNRRPPPSSPSNYFAICAKKRRTISSGSTFSAAQPPHPASL